MKKILFVLLFLFLASCTNQEEPNTTKTLREFIDEITLAGEAIDDISLASSYDFNGETILAVWESSNTSVLSNNGEVTRPLSDVSVSLKLTLATSTELETKDFTILVKALSDEEVLESVLSKINLVSETKLDINLTSSITAFSQRFTITWTSSNQDALTSNGKIGLIENDVDVVLTASAKYNQNTLTKDFTIKAKALSDDEKADYITNLLDLPAMTNQDLTLITTFPFNLTGTWESSNQTIITNDGKINQNISGNIQVTLTLILSNDLRRTFEVTVSKNNHLIIDNTFTGTKNNVEISNNKLVLSSNQLTGTYESAVIETLSFNELVGSWAALSSKTATVDFMVRLRVNQTWSKYFSYGEWGFGLNNKTTNSTDGTIAYMSVDEIKVSGGKTANAIQFKAVLKRTTAQDASPELSMLVAALNIPGYTYSVDVSSLPTSKVYDVPTLYQHVVPTIGNSICSPTSATMLLMYLGVDVANASDNTYTYPHEYLARRAFDHGADIFGNWVYNTVAISAFGIDSYVMRMYSHQELLVHLNEVGPVSASIKGYVNVEKGNDYNTNGHLIVVKGYRYVNDQLYIIVNDPNISNVDDEMKVENFLTVWRNVVYIVE